MIIGCIYQNKYVEYSAFRASSYKMRLSRIVIFAIFAANKTHHASLLNSTPRVGFQFL